MIVRCLACGKVMVADDKHRGCQICGCKNQTMVDWCDEQQCKDGIDDVLNMSDNVVQNNTNVKGD